MTVSISSKFGTLETTHGSSVKSVAIKMGNAAFFEPEIVISPLSRRPPSMLRISILDPLCLDNPGMPSVILMNLDRHPLRLSRNQCGDRRSLVRSDFHQQTAAPPKHHARLNDQTRNTA